jgi:hypothetical protein
MKAVISDFLPPGFLDYHDEFKALESDIQGANFVEKLNRPGFPGGSNF